MKRIRGRKLQERNAIHLCDNPVCAHCHKKAAIEVDHVIALCNGGEDTDENIQGLCDGCHAIKTAKDMGYKIKGNDIHGQPTDANHHWNR